MISGERGRSAGGRMAWHACALLLVVLAPSQLWRGVPAWRLPAGELVLPLLGGLAYLLLALAVRETRPPGSRLRWLVAVAAGLLFMGAAIGALLLLRPELPVSWAVAALGVVLALVLVAAPGWLERRLAPTLGLMVVCLAAIVFVGHRRSQAVEVARCGSRVVFTALHAVKLDCFENLVARPLESDGGGIAAFDDGFLLVTGDGRFYRLHASAVDQRLSSESITLVAPLDRPGFLADQPATAASPRRTRLRVTGLLVDATTEPARVFVAHQYWNRADKCFTMRVSATTLPTRPGAGGEARWQTLFDSRPCLAKTASFDDIETGGRLALDPRGRLLLSTGDHGFSGRDDIAALAQGEDNDYGKILRLDGKGGREIVTRGHRNPQGLAVGRAGTVWASEHGPQGGDEINVIVDGANYGWPLVSYGTDYGLEYWPSSGASLDHGRFAEPAHVFVPGIGISNLIETSSPQFPRWDGDLLVGSLRLQTLYRVMTRGSRVLYVEPIPIGRRIRDLAQGSDGRIAFWTDEGDVLSMAVAARAPGGAALYRRCIGCHEAGADTAFRAAPELRGVVGRKVASVPGFAYSESLKGMQGVWTKERLDSFLADPSAFAPGNRMRGGAMPSSAERRVLIDYLGRQE